ncbi:MAG: enoyl-CoA hydratase-related protein, partial [Pseudomonadota bacterium]
MESSFFKIERDGAVAHLIMAKPERANAMSPDFWDDLPRLTRALAEDGETRAMVISAEGRHFTSGMDLAAFGDIASAGE